MVAPERKCRPTQISAGVLAYRRSRELEVLLAHPGGPFWAKKDTAAWTIPKGLVEPGDDPIGAARREFKEETGFVADGQMIELAPVRQKSGKLVHAFGLDADFDLARFASNTFEIEWPPRSGRRQTFPEIDRIAYFTLPIAKIKILAYQVPLLSELEKLTTAASCGE
jgi:predicted NUDIX family NTP pyrophosphohydrolase